MSAPSKRRLPPIESDIPLSVCSRASSTRVFRRRWPHCRVVARGYSWRPRSRECSQSGFSNTSTWHGISTPFTAASWTDGSQKRATSSVMCWPVPGSACRRRSWWATDVTTSSARCRTRWFQSEHCGATDQRTSWWLPGRRGSSGNRAKPPGSPSNTQSERGDADGAASRERYSSVLLEVVLQRDAELPRTPPHRAARRAQRRRHAGTAATVPESTAEARGVRRVRVVEQVVSEETHLIAIPRARPREPRIHQIVARQQIRRVGVRRRMCLLLANVGVVDVEPEPSRIADRHGVRRTDVVARRRLLREEERPAVGDGVFHLVLRQADRCIERKMLGRCKLR